ncbi:hypothetical protein ACX80V_08470 [Arthrobacter sp. MDT3-24]
MRVVDGRDHTGVGDWPFTRPLDWQLALHLVAIDLSAPYRKSLKKRPPRALSRSSISMGTRRRVHRNYRIR